jgi:chromate transporter
VALCQLLPGPTSSQVGFLIGLRHAGFAGALAAWLGFTLPSALTLYVCALLSAQARGASTLALIHGLTLVAVAIVAQALWSLARRLCVDLKTGALALASALLLLLWQSASAQLVVLAAGAAAGAVLCRGAGMSAGQLMLPVRREVAWLAAGAYLLLLLVLPLLALRFPHGNLALAEVFYRAGALVFGGGHVVLPLLRDALVPQGWISDEGFLAAYGLAQAVPGPLFTVAAYLGAASAWTHTPGLTAALAVVFIFLPGLLLALAGALWWSALARYPVARASLTGINAVVVGILAAALYHPLWTTAVHGLTDVLLIGAALLLLALGAAPLAAVILCAAGSVLLALGG